MLWTAVKKILVGKRRWKGMRRIMKPSGCRERKQGMIQEIRRMMKERKRLLNKGK